MSYPYVISSAKAQPAVVVNRYDRLRETGAAVPYCEHVILVEFGVHPSELRRMLMQSGGER